MPLPLRALRVFLIVCLFIWGFGMVAATHHVLDGLGTGETWVQTAGDLRVLVERTLLVIAAGFAYWSVGARKIAGRWIALGLACVVSYRLAFAASYPWRAIHGDFKVEPPRIPYSNVEEAVLALLMVLVIMSWVAWLMAHLAFGTRVRDYFNPRRVGPT